ncbi:MAG TPA: hypothetical protein DCZ10_01920 [Pelotomaculum sp.]|nr:hypothetical protein [Pelotomaculum sp.]
MKLYISDLDGTLLNSHKEMSEYTRNTVNTLIAHGGHFSIATARTAESTTWRHIAIMLPSIMR